MTTGSEAPSPPSPSRRHLYLLLGAVMYIALLIAGLGITSLFLDADVINADGFGQLPGAVGVVASTLAWAAIVAPALRGRGSLGAAVLAGVIAAAAYCLGVFVTAIVVGADLAVAASAVSRLVTLGFALVIAIAGVFAATGALVAVRSSGGTARWPWEK